MKTFEIVVGKAQVTHLRKILKMEKLPRNLQDRSLALYTANFGGGIVADIGVCSGQENAYLNPVLFHDGIEVASIQDESETIVGEYPFEYDGEEYKVIVKEGK